MVWVCWWRGDTPARQQEAGDGGGGDAASHNTCPVSRSTATGEAAGELSCLQKTQHAFPSSLTTPGLLTLVAVMFPAVVVLHIAISGLEGQAKGE